MQEVSINIGTFSNVFRELENGVLQKIKNVFSKAVSEIWTFLSYVFVTSFENMISRNFLENMQRWKSDLFENAQKCSN